MDATGLVALESAIAAAHEERLRRDPLGLQAQPDALLENAEFQHRPWRLMIRPDLASAIAAAEEVVALAGPPKGGNAGEKTLGDAGDKTLVDLPRV